MDTTDKFYVLRGGDTEPSIDGPYSAAELEAMLQRDYAGCVPPTFEDKMPIGSLMYMSDKSTVVFRAEVVVPKAVLQISRWSVG